ncbi:uncharacterized protein CC84DRAFT_704745 [Paraphaeosphaeria sporulosa]|uniref:Uncharacterized protein n=1 Tax=Paraphaeosphaeria sporulosa TaxID=1460663 RepID=A0A177CJG9_9PLEO|nr:uncharacterized protein CC84DRAFT_704745 [Paraphaeosphaeria sporulosa]OAG07665.1 hypothetical protein CC84DRAFT_704745 [Paraphaeosphaeria sporulosa]
MHPSRRRGLSTECQPHSRGRPQLTRSNVVTLNHNDSKGLLGASSSRLWARNALRGVTASMVHSGSVQLHVENSAQWLSRHGTYRASLYITKEVNLLSQEQGKYDSGNRYPCTAVSRWLVASSRVVASKWFITPPRFGAREFRKHLHVDYDQM